MFGSKKNDLPPRPHPPLPRQILEDLENASINDVAFKILNKDKDSSNVKEDPNISSNSSPNPEVIYKTVKAYLEVNEQLKQLNESLEVEMGNLTQSEQKMQMLVQEIRKQAQAALVT